MPYTTEPEKTARRRSERLYSPSVRERTEYLNEVKRTASERSNVTTPITSPRRFNSPRAKQKFTDLVAIFSRVNNKRVMRMSSPRPCSQRNLYK